MTTTASIDKNEWERAEIERSAFEADHTPDARLVADRANVARYLSPKPTTVYEYKDQDTVSLNVRVQRNF